MKNIDDFNAISANFNEHNEILLRLGLGCLNSLKLKNNSFNDMISSISLLNIRDIFCISVYYYLMQTIIKYEAK